MAEGLVGSFVLSGRRVYMEGYDLGKSFTMYLSCATNDIRSWLDAGIYVDEDYIIPASWENLYFSVSEDSATVSMYTEELEDQVYKNRVNTGVLKMVGSLMRGSVLSCNTNNREDSIEAFSCGFTPKKTHTYIIDDLMYDGRVYSARVQIKMCTVISMHIESKDDDSFSLDLDRNTEKIGIIRKLTRRQHKIPLILPESKKAMDDFSLDISDDIYTLDQIIKMNPDKNYQWLFGRKYEIVQSIDRLEEICEEMWNHDGIISFDTETTGLDFTFKCFYGQGDKLVGMVFSIREGEGWYIPIRNKKFKNICEESDINYIVNKYFKKILEQKPLLCQNGGFDWKVMYSMGIFINLVHDTLIFNKLTIWNDHRNIKLGLKEMTKATLGRDSLELSDFVSGKWGEGSVKFWDLDYESTKLYACPDTDNALSLLNYGLRENYLERYGANKVYEIEVAFSIVIAYQEFYGHCVDVERTERLVKEIKENKEESYNHMVEIVGHDFNPRSTKDLAKVMFEELGYPVLKRTKTGNPSAGKKVLEAMEKSRNENGDPLYPLVSWLREFKENAQLESNFTKNLDKLATDDGFMFSKVNQFLETGRVSVSEPNYQSYNDTVKKYVIPREGFYMMDSDYSSIEYRILASMAGQMNLVERFKDPDMDYHTYQASRMFRVPYELVTKPLRSQAKGINFGLPYGMADPKLGESLYGARTPENTARAAKMRKLYFEGQEHIEQFFTKARSDGLRNLYSDTYFGRRRYFDDRTTDDGSIQRQAGNNRIQGTAADIYKISMVRLLNRIRKNGWLGKVLISCFVHDECLLEIHKSIDPCVMLKNLRECLMLDIKGWCPLYIGAGFGTNWYDAKKTEIPVQVQEQLINEFGVTGIDWWDGDTDRLFDWEVSRINDYKRDRVIDYLKNEDNWHKVLQPVENGFAHEVLDEILAGRHVDGVADRDVHTDKDTVTNLENFCKAFDILDLFEKADIQRPVYTEGSSSDALDDGDDVIEEEISDAKYMEMILMRVNSIGASVDTVNKKLYIRYDDDVTMRKIRYLIDRNEGSYEVYAVKDGEVFSTGLYTSSLAYTSIMKIYLLSRRATV